MSDFRTPVKAVLPTPSNAIGSILGFNNNVFLKETGEVSHNGTRLEQEQDKIKPAGEEQMLQFVKEFEEATEKGKAHT